MSNDKLLAIVNEEVAKDANGQCAQRICARIMYAVAEEKFRPSLSDRAWKMFIVSVNAGMDAAALKAKLGDMEQVGLNSEDADKLFVLYDVAVRICEFMLDEFAHSRYKSAEPEKDSLVSVSADLYLVWAELQSRQAHAVMCFLNARYIRSIELLLEYLRVFLFGEADHVRLMAECSRAIEIMRTQRTIRGNNGRV